MMESPSDTSSVQPAPPSLALSRETPHRHSPAPPPPDRYHAMPSSSSPTPLAAPRRSSRGAFTYPMRSPSLALRPLCFGLESPQRDSPAPPPPCSVPSSSTTLATPPRSSRAASTYPLPSPSLKLPRSFHRDTPHCDSPLSDYAKLYAVSESEIMLVAELEHMPARGNSYEYRGGVEPSTAEASGELLLAYFHKGLLDRMASFIFLEDQSESDRSDTGESEKEEGSDEEEENDRESEEEEGSDEEQENDGESEEEEEESEEEDSDDQSLESYFLELRMWPTRANLVLYDSRSWVFTRAYCLQWLSTKQVEPLVKMIKESGDDIKVDGSLLVNLPPTGRSKLQGPMVSSRAVNKFVEIKLCPSLIDFREKELLGKGATSNVRLCTYIPENKEYAVKIVRLNEDDEIQSEPREVTILSDLRNEFVVRFSQAWVESDNLLQYESATDDEPSSDESSDGANGLHCSKYLMIHMEYCPRTLMDYLSREVRKFEAQVSSHFFGEITKGLRYIHKEGVIHRDLKPGNVFLSTDGSIKIADFGQSCFRPNDSIFFKATPNLGTVYYEAPELKAGEHISEKVDIYSLGVIYFELFNCFAKTTLQKYRELVALREQDKRGKTWKGDSSLCRQMIAEDPLGRPSADEIMEILYKSTRSSKKGEKEESVDRFHSVGK